MQSFLGVSSSSGAECSATQSPFSALLNKAPGGSGPDTARRDLVPAQQQHHSASSSRFRSPHAQGHGQGQGQSAEAAAFFDQQAQQQQQHIGAIPHSSSSTSSAPPPPAAFDVHALRANLPSPQQHSAWHAQFVNDGATSGDSGAFAAEFEAGRMQQQQQHGRAGHSGSLPMMHASMPAMSTMQQPRMMPYHGPSQYRQQQQQQVEGKGKAREAQSQEEQARWEREFERIANSHPRNTEESARVVEINDEERPGQASDETREEGPMRTAASDEHDLLAELERTWQGIESNLNEEGGPSGITTTSDAELAKWEAQFGSQFANLLDASSSASDDLNELAEHAPFPFTAREENPHADAVDPFAEGQRLLRTGAPLAQAALAFEAACMREPARAEAWLAAGETWAADERELKGVRALQEAIRCDQSNTTTTGTAQQSKAATDAKLALAIAYVNEGQEMRALAMLERWLAVTYPDLATSSSHGDSAREMDDDDPWHASNKVIDLFLAAANAGPRARRDEAAATAGAEIDPDVQVGLGVLFYSNSDYERARDCFEAALATKPDDFLLWNRLGATLANGGRPEDAIFAYRKALALRPTFTRAIYNLAVSALNIGCYQEAAEHLLAALEGQTKRQESSLAGGPTGAAHDHGDGSENLWNTLRRAFLCMDRHDLAELARPGADLAQFRGQGLDF